MQTIITTIASKLPKHTTLPDGVFSPEQEARFLSRLCSPDENNCIVWGGRRDKDGGMLKMNGKELSARRVAWMIQNGAIPTGIQIKNTCKTYLCMNPEHLFAYDPKAPKLPKVKVPSTTRQGKPSKFTAEDILSIRQRYLDGETLHMIAQEHGVTDMTVSLIVNYKTHRHVPPAAGLEPKQLP